MTKQFQVEVKLNFVRSITSELEDAIFGAFCSNDMFCHALICSLDGDVFVSITFEGLTEEEGMSQIKSRLAKIMFNMKVEALE